MIKGLEIHSANPTVGLVTVSAPEAHWNPDVYESGKKALTERGIKIVESATNLTRYLYLAEKPEIIAETLHKMFCNPEVDFIMCTGGGNCMNKIIPYLDMQLIREHYKPFVGISDITALLLALLNENVVSFHGPFVLWNYGVENTPTKYTHENMLNVLSGFKGELPHASSWNVFRSGSATGKLIGGNISTISNVIGTKYCPVELFRDKILFIEDVAEVFPALDSKLTHMGLLGVFDIIKGILIGKMPECEPPEESPDISFEDFLELTFSGMEFPIVYNCDFGHVSDNLCLPLGCSITLNADEKSEPIVFLNEKGVN